MPISGDGSTTARGGIKLGPCPQIVSFHDAFGTILEALEQKNQVVEFTIEFVASSGVPKWILFELTSCAGQHKLP